MKILAKSANSPTRKILDLDTSAIRDGYQEIQRRFDQLRHEGDWEWALLVDEDQIDPYIAFITDEPLKVLGETLLKALVDSCPSKNGTGHSPRSLG